MMRNLGALVRCMIAAVPLALALSPPAQAATFPADTSWIPLTQGGATLGDPGDDSQDNSRDIIGNMAKPAVAVFNDGVNFFVRLRLDSNPVQGRGLRPYGWGVLIDINLNLNDYEFVIMVNGIHDVLQFSQNTISTGTGDSTDIAETVLRAAPINLDPGGNTRVTLADSGFGGTADYFLDFAIPVSALYEAGITATTPLILVAGTSSNGTSMEMDISGTSQSPGPGTLPGAGSDPIYPDGSPYGSICGDGFMLMPEACDDGDGVSGDGCSATCTIEDGYTCTGQPSVCIQDTDDDGVPDGIDTDPTDPLVCADTDGDDCDDCALGMGASPGNDGPDADGDGLCDAGDMDDDNDGLGDAEEVPAGTNPNDADTDDDGVVDGDEPEWNMDTDGDGAINALDADSDADSIFDGTELGVTAPGQDTDVSTGAFVSDADASSTTSPLVADTDQGGIADGIEDANHNGAIDSGETDPNNPIDDAIPDDNPDDNPNDNPNDNPDDLPGGDTDGDGLADDDDNCPGVANPSQSDLDGDMLGDECDADSNGDGFFDDIGVSGGGCSAGGAQHGIALFLAMVLVLPLWRRRTGAEARRGK